MNAFWNHICSFVWCSHTKWRTVYFLSLCSNFYYIWRLITTTHQVTPISSIIYCRTCFLDLALFSLFCGWTTYVSKHSAKNWMLYCVWNLPSTKWDYFTCLTYDTPVYMSQFDICPFCNSMTLLTHVLLLIHCNPRCFLAELLCNQLSPSYIWTADYASVTTLHWFILNCILFFQTISAICQDHSVLQCCLQRLLPFPLAWYHLQISCKIFSVPPHKTIIKVWNIAGPRSHSRRYSSPTVGH